MIWNDPEAVCEEILDSPGVWPTRNRHPVHSLSDAGLAVVQGTLAHTIQTIMRLANSASFTVGCVRILECERLFPYVDLSSWVTEQEDGPWPQFPRWAIIIKTHNFLCQIVLPKVTENANCVIPNLKSCSSFRTDTMA